MDAQAKNESQSHLLKERKDQIKVLEHRHHELTQELKRLEGLLRHAESDLERERAVKAEAEEALKQQRITVQRELDQLKVFDISSK